MTDKPLVDRLLLLINEWAGGNKKGFAEILGITPGNVHDWVNRDRLPSAEHLANIQDKLHISIDWLLTGKGERYTKPIGDVRETAPSYGGMYLPEWPADSVNVI